MKLEMEVLVPPELHRSEFRNQRQQEAETRMFGEQPVHRVIDASRCARNPLSFSMKHLSFYPKRPAVRRRPHHLFHQIAWCLDVSGLSDSLYLPKKTADILDMLGNVRAIDKIKAFIRKRKISRISLHELTAIRFQRSSTLSRIFQKPIQQGIRTEPGIVTASDIEDARFPRQPRFQKNPSGTGLGVEPHRHLKHQIQNQECDRLHLAMYHIQRQNRLSTSIAQLSPDCPGIALLRQNNRITVLQGVMGFPLP